MVELRGVARRKMQLAHQRGVAEQPSPIGCAGCLDGLVEKQGREALELSAVPQQAFEPDPGGSIARQVPERHLVGGDRLFGASELFLQDVRDAMQDERGLFGRSVSSSSLRSLRARLSTAIRPGGCAACPARRVRGEARARGPGHRPTARASGPRAGARNHRRDPIQRGDQLTDHRRHSVACSSSTSTCSTQLPLSASARASAASVGNGLGGLARTARSRSAAFAGSPARWS